ncbi:MAG: hydroxysqualene dehydroxylase HpnE [Gemmataceae bacterium]|nr:hydroxysqualene dehydroxylase HpnE [Gemmataceae bacterium]
MTRGDRVLIIGGGLAGLATATALAPLGFKITLLEARQRLGGRASSFQDAGSGQLLDTCQHVSMGCCTNLAHFCRTLGIDHLLAPQPSLYFMTPDGKVSPFHADRLPAPLHLARSFARAHYLTWNEKARIAYALLRLRQADATSDPPFLDWLVRHGQTPRTIDRFWGVVLTSALNESPERIGLRYARKVFVDGFLRHRRGFEVSVPTVPLGRLYGEELQRWCSRQGVELRLNGAVRALAIEDNRVLAARTRQEENLEADWYVCATPFDRLLGLLPQEATDRHPYFTNLRRLETSPITSVHLWYRGAVTHLPHVVLVDCVGQWMFNRGESAPGEFYVQIVVSAARHLRGLGRDEIERRIVAEMASLFPAASSDRLHRARVVTERAATFSAVPGVDAWRPSPASPFENLFIAGDWTATGWPATMEGAVRSGYLAADALLRRMGRVTPSFVQPDL